MINWEDEDVQREAANIDRTFEIAIIIGLILALVFDTLIYLWFCKGGRP